MSDSVERALAPCGCCAADVARTPVSVRNDPGKSALSYRVGSAATFLESMRRSAGEHSATSTLRSRTDGDHTVAVMDAWACALDVLTFYTERIAQESYLRTATEGRSLVELARTVGYERGHGRASTAWLAFTLEDSVSAPPLVPVPSGTQVASRPGPGELPQTFETVEPLEARPPWNAMRARATRVDLVETGDTSLHLSGIVTDLHAGDMLLFAGPADSAAAAAGKWSVRTTIEVTPLPRLGVTRVRWDEALGTALPDPLDLRVWVLRLRTGLFGAAAPDWRTIPAETKAQFTGGTFTHTRVGRESDERESDERASVSPGTGIGTSIGTTISGHPHIFQLPGPDDWPGFTVKPSGAPANTIDLDGAHPEVVPGGWLVLRSGTVTNLYRVVKATQGSRSDFAISGRTTRVTLEGPTNVATAYGSALRTTVAFAQSEQLSLAESPDTSPVQGAVVELASPVAPLAPGRAIVVTGVRPRLRVAERVQGLVLVQQSGATVALHPGDELEVTAPTTPSGADTTWPVRFGDKTGTVLASDGELIGADPPADADVIAELATIDEPASTEPEVWSLALAADLAGSYERASVRVLANVAPASHGETRREVLGSGEAAQPFQRFKLAQAPLTYTDGSSLVVRVDDVRWDEVDSLFGAGPADRVYTVRIDDEGNVTLHFGDGVTGARLPTGHENVTAVYRVGTGLAGVLPAARLTLLMTRPLGVRSVTNPLPTGLAADLDDPAAVRSLAPRTALTLGRAVSVSDFADLARATPGIAKAVAVVGWHDERPVVHVTVAGDCGQVVDAGALAGVTSSLLAAGVPRLGVTVSPAGLLTFDLTLTVFTDPAREVDSVTADVRAAMLTGFGFDARSLGQPVTASEVVGAAQAVTGVVAVTLNKLTRTGNDDNQVVVTTAGAGPGEPARLLVINPAGLSLVAAT